MRRASGASQSGAKWNNRSMEEDPNILKFMAAENRKKYNLSCGDLAESRSKGKDRSKSEKKKFSGICLKNGKGQSKKNMKKIEE